MKGSLIGLNLLLSTSLTQAEKSSVFFFNLPCRVESFSVSALPPISGIPPWCPAMQNAAIDSRFLKAYCVPQVE